VVDKDGKGQGDNISLAALVEKIMSGEKIFLQATQLGIFIVNTEVLRLSYAIKTSVVGNQVILERWDIGRDLWDNFSALRENDLSFN